MTHRRAWIPVLTVALALAACGGGRQDPEEVAQARQDSIAAAEAAELEAQRQAELEAERQAALEAQRRAEEEARRQAELEAQREADGVAEVEETEDGVATEEDPEQPGAREIIAEMVHYGFDRAVIRPDDEDILLRKLAVLRSNPNLRLRIEGHADERGSTEYNLALGQRRAEAAKQFLVGYGIDASRLQTVSFGEEQPLVEGSTEDAYALNRRAEFVILNPNVLGASGSR